MRYLKKNVNLLSILTRPSIKKENPPYVGNFPQEPPSLYLVEFWGIFCTNILNPASVNVLP